MFHCLNDSFHTNMNYAIFYINAFPLTNPTLFLKKTFVNV